MRAGRLRRKVLIPGLHYAVLGLLGLMFSLPFIWLILTTAKRVDEIAVYPPKWLPVVPRVRWASPLVLPPGQISPYKYDLFEAPDGVGPERWLSLAPLLQEKLWERAAPAVAADTVASRLGRADKETLRHSLTHVLWNEITPRVPDGAWLLPDDEAAAAAANVVCDEILDFSLTLCVKRFGLGGFGVTGIDGAMLMPDELETTGWELVPGTEGDAIRGTDAADVEGVPLLLIAYDFDADPEARPQFVTTLRLPIPANRVRLIAPTYSMDGSYCLMHPVIETSEAVYTPQWDLGLSVPIGMTDVVQPRLSFYPKADQFQDLILLQRAEGATTTVTDPNTIKVTLTLRPQRQAAAVWGKFRENYGRAVRFVPFLRYTYTSALLVLLNVTFGVLSSSLVAFGFSRLRWFGRDVLFLAVLGTMMIPPQVTMVPNFVIMKYLGWYNTLKPLWVGSLFGSAFHIFLLRQFLLGIPTDLEDSAKIDGCGYLRIWREIMLPLTKPALIVVGIFTFMGTWNNFMGPLIFINSEERVPLALGLFQFQLARGGEFGEMMAASLIMIAPVITVFFLAQKYFIRGVTLTGMKV